MGAGTSNNTGFITGGGGVISIDTCSTQPRTRAYLDARRGGDREQALSALDAARPAAHLPRLTYRDRPGRA